MMGFLVGASKKDLTPAHPDGMHFFGWGLHQHVARKVGAPIHARAVAVSVGSSKIVMVCLDLGCVSEALRIEVIRRSGLQEHELMLTATHTHSAPGGFSDYVLYALSCGGFDPTILEIYTTATVAAIQEALSNMKPAELRMSEAAFDPSIQVAFNRSISAYNKNPSVIKRARNERNLAVNRNMTLIRFDTPDGKPIAMWNWFGVHGTCIHSDYDIVHPDNKGTAATFFESEMESKGHTGFVATFAQGAAGDITPNFRKYFLKQNKRGISRDDVESCKYNADLQFQHALALFDSARATPALTSKVDSVIEYNDMSRVTVDQSQWGNNLKTGPAVVGIPQIRGTSEGWGASWLLVFIVSWYVRISSLIRCRFFKPEVHCSWHQDSIQFNKIAIISSTEHTILGSAHLDRMPLPNFLDPVVAVLKRWHASPHIRERAFSPQILPVQLVILGPIAIAGVPAEFTTTSGTLLSESLRAPLQSSGVSHVITQSYSNAYSSYVATPEEFVMQKYEGGCTQFGKWTLPAYIDSFKKMISRWSRGEKAPVNAPKRPSREYLDAIRSQS